MERILILGGVAAGLSAASRARKLSPRAEITVLERGPVAGYGACGLPHFLAGEIAGLDRLIAHPAEFFRQQRRLDLRVGHEALEIEPGRRRVRVRQGREESWFAYDRLVIATGARPRWQPPTPGGLPLRNVFSPVTWTGTQALDAALRGGAIRRAVVVGGGYIGVEIAEALARRHERTPGQRLQVTLIAAHATLLRGFDAELAEALPPQLVSAGVELRQPERVRAIEGAPGGRVLGVVTETGRLACDAVVNCGGLRPETGLAQACGVVLGPSGAIAVDERQQTSVPGIYAAGDCAETRHLITGAPVWIPLGAAANKQGRVAGENAAGGRARFPGVLGTLAVTAFGTEWGRSGLSLEQAASAGYDATGERVDAGSRAGYLDPRPVSVKIVYDRRTQRLLGCHVRGAPGTVAGRLDTAAAAMSAGMGLEQIETLDLAYAPGLAPLYEPFLIAAHNARGRREG